MKEKYENYIYIYIYILVKSVFRILKLLSKNGVGPLKYLSHFNEVSYVPIQSMTSKVCVIKLTKCLQL